jgi:hypothetical protein
VLAVEGEAGQHRQLHVTVGQQQVPPQAVATVKAVRLCVLHLNLCSHSTYTQTHGCALAAARLYSSLQTCQNSSQHTTRPRWCIVHTFRLSRHSAA